ncbi:hypothetical protein J6TS7_25390 [Paenibacillus dendritiformis]|nr:MULTISPECIES: hypothetical protein [Paenibacillus]MEB9892940.1 hypothetical protein [Bacillus cereus]GIO78929.1 hypothetical protein J6TS7_25390 [Paenibacillus dendritiformis]
MNKDQEHRLHPLFIVFSLVKTLRNLWPLLLIAASDIRWKPTSF